MAEVFSFCFLLIFACCLFLFFGDTISWRYKKKDLTKEYQMISQKEMALANELAEANAKIDDLEKQIEVAMANAIQDETRIAAILAECEKLDKKHSHCKNMILHCFGTLLDLNKRFESLSNECLKERNKALNQYNYLQKLNSETNQS